MCLIYYRDSARHLAPANVGALKRAYVGNPDGVGIAWFAGEWQVWRSVDASWREVAERLCGLDAARFIVHFRWATHGGVELENCHPFQVGPQSFLFHNGSFAGVSDEESDTGQVAGRMATIVANGGRLADAWRLLKLLADGNRLLLTLPGGKVASAGAWIQRRDGCFSNGACLRRDNLYSPRSFAAWYRDFA
jgi:hypothetical protein